MKEGKEEEGGIKRVKKEKVRISETTINKPIKTRQHEGKAAQKRE